MNAPPTEPKLRVLLADDYDSAHVPPVPHV